MKMTGARWREFVWHFFRGVAVVGVFRGTDTAAIFAGKIALMNIFTISGANRRSSGRLAR
jgi:hypothetical protein